MITVQLNNLSFCFHDDISQLPADRYKDFQKYQLLDSGVGSSMDDISTRFERLFSYLSAGKVADCQKEAENLYYTHYFILTFMNIKHLSFGFLLHSVNSELITDFTEGSIKKIISTLSEAGLTQAVLEESVESSKKKFSHN